MPEVLTFDGGIFTPQRVKVKEGDRALAPHGALTWQIITTEVALAGTIGIDCKLVHGDRWQQIEGSQMVNILKNNTYMVFQNEMYTVIQNRTTNIVGNYTKTIIGVYNHTTINAHIQVNVNVRNNTYICPKVEVHSAPRQSSEPTGWFESVVNYLISCIFSFGMTAIKIEITGNSTGFTMSKFELTAIQTSLVGLENKADGAENKLAPLKNKLEALANRVQAAQPSLGILKGHLVATTLKTLVLGVNQYI